MRLNNSEQPTTDQSESREGQSGAKARVVAVIPAFNEERFIASVVINTRNHADQVIVVDDGSSDRTAELAEIAGAEVVRLIENQGKAGALNAGFRAAAEHEPDVIVCLDGDAQHDPSEIPEVVEPVLRGDADVVIGSRFLDKKSRIPGWRQVGQHTLTAVTNLTSGVKTTDSQSGYRAFSPKAAAALKFRSRHLSVESEMQFLIDEAGLEVAEVPISVTYQDGNKRNPVIQGVQILDAILSLVARRRPVLFLVVPGALAFCIGLVLGSRVFFVMQNSGELLTGTAILTSLLIMGGLLLSLSGIMLYSMQHFIQRIREEVQGLLDR